ncbi:MAG TPA: chloride channel protein [Pyrinomonadaceae bacterium]|nr:chloride channel protein [Pyrinomonadaceae bacterium]
MTLAELAQRWSVTWRRANAVLLRLFLRLVPAETHRVFALTLIAGASCGLAAVFFHLSIIGAETRLIDKAMSASGKSWIWWTILTPTIGGLLSGVLLQYVFPGARGSGIPQVKVAYVIKDGRVPLREAVGKFLVGVLQIGTGSSLGRDGPTVHICAGVASTLGRSAALSRESLKRLLPVGAAAGIAAAFNAPIAAITFTIEEVVGDLDQAVLAWIVVAAAIAPHHRRRRSEAAGEHNRPACRACATRAHSGESGGEIGEVRRTSAGRRGQKVWESTNRVIDHERRRSRSGPCGVRRRRS